MEVNDNMAEKQKRKRRGERADGRILVTLVTGRTPDGKPKREYFYGKTRAEAEAKRDAYKQKLNLGVVEGKTTLAEWIETYKQLYRKKVNPAYIVNDNVPYNRLSKALGHMKLSEVREIHLQNALNAVDGMSAATIKTYYQVMFRVFERARKNKFIMDNPAEGLILPNGTRGSHRAIERWESDCILQNWQAHRAGLWAMIMMLAGLRRGELIALNWDNVDMENRTITVCQVAVIKSNQSLIEDRAKTAAGIRVIPICQPLWDALNTIPPEDRTGLVCKSTTGELLSGISYKRGWDGFNLAMQRILNDEPLDQKGKRITLDKKIAEAKAQGKEYIIFKAQAHDLRHTFATALYDAGVPVKAAQYYLGHADIRMTLDLYTHLSEERKIASRSQLVGFLDGWLKDSKALPGPLSEP